MAKGESTKGVLKELEIEIKKARKEFRERPTVEVIEEAKKLALKGKYNDHGDNEIILNDEEVLEREINTVIDDL